MSENPILPKPKKPVKYTGAALRIMQTCDKAFHEHRFVLLYFTNRKQFNQMFSMQSFKQLIKNHFTFLQLSRADKAGNWLTTTYHFQSSPYYAIIDPSTGDFLTIHYKDMSLDELGAWLAKFSSKFSSATSVFPSLIEKLQEQKRKSAFAYGTKLRITFACSRFEDKVLYVNKAAPFQIAFEKYCAEMNIDMDQYYFLFHALQVPPEMTPSQLSLKNGSVITVHPLEDRTSTEQISISVVGLDSNSSVFHIAKGKRIGQFLKHYAEVNQLQLANTRFTLRNEIVNEDLTFAEHGIKDGDQIFVNLKTFMQPNDYYNNYYRMMKPNEIPPMIPSEGYDMQMPQIGQMQMQQPMMYMYNQSQQKFPMPPAVPPISSIPNQLSHQMPPQMPPPPQIAGPMVSQITPNQMPSQIQSLNITQPMQQMTAQMPPQIPGQITGQMPSFNQYPIHHSKVYPLSKPGDQTPNQSIWEGFD